MTDWQIKVTLYCALSASALLCILILLMPEDIGARAQSVLCLWGCGLLAGMSWQTMICRKHDQPRDIGGSPR